MIRELAFIMLLSGMPAFARAAPATMRVDYYHTGNASEERFSLDRVVVEPLEWPGNPARVLDDTGLGKYFFQVADVGSGRILYSRGFASVFGEWETTAEAKEKRRTFHESLRFPRPEALVRIALKKRDAKNVFREIWTAVGDPKDMFVGGGKPLSPGPLLRNRHAKNFFGEIWRAVVDPKDMSVDAGKPPSPGPLLTIEKHGEPADKVDFLILGDGYTAGGSDKFDKEARRLTEILFSVSPFK